MYNMENINGLDEEKEFIQKIFRLFDSKEDLNKRLIGTGNVGSVWKISDKLCLKVRLRTYYTEIPENFKKCENLCVPLKTFVSQSGKYIGFVQKYLNLQNLEYLIKNEIRLSEKQAANVLCDILKGLKVIHEKGYVHRDFHPGNIMLTAKDRSVMAAIIDFDEMKRTTPETRACFQYNGYQAPEIVFNNDIYNDKSEMFTVGIILWELIQGKCPFGGYNFFGKIVEESWDKYTQNREFYNDRVKVALMTLPNYLGKAEGISKECASLLRLLLNFNRANRITAKEALNHPFFRRNLQNEYHNKTEYGINNKNVIYMSERE